jgi:hypothetical protein
MKSGRYREGTWQRSTIGDLTKWIADMEEVWRDGRGVIPGERRAPQESDVVGDGGYS